MLMAGGTMAQETAQVIGGTEDDLRTFITRILTGYGPVDASTEIYIADVPEDVAQWAPIPEGATLVGSVRRSGAGMFGPGVTSPDAAMTEVFINGGTPEANFNFFLDQLSSQGFTVTDSNLNDAGGFTPSVNGYGNLCDEAADVSINFDTSQTPSGQVYSTVRIQSPADVYQCSQSGRPVDQPLDPMMDVIPALRVPEGVSVTTNRNGTMYYNAQMVGLSAEINSDLALADITAAYTAQLEEAGWEQILEETATESTLSHWRITAEDGSEWLGIFSLQSSPAGEVVYLANITVMAAGQG
jgi:hypothetical protein